MNQYALEITKAYMSKQLLNNIEISEYAKIFNDTYNAVCNFLKSLED